MTGPGWWAARIGEEESRQEDRPAPVLGRSRVGIELVAAPPVLLVTDADSTLVRQEVIDELAACAGVEGEVAAITAAAMRGEIDFTESLHRRVAMLRGLSVSVFDQVRERLTVTAGARELIAWTHSVGAKFGVVSGGFTEVLQPLVDELGIDHLAANHLEVVDGKLTGRVLGNVVDSAVKVARVREWSGARMGRAVTVGDGANDIPMLTSAGMGVAFCAKSAVREAASSYLDLCRLDAVVGLLGQDFHLGSGVSEPGRE